jgi:hypothetical protein
MRIILLALLLQGCATFIGVAVHSDIDKPEYSGNNPLFVLRVEHENMFCEHISSIPDVEKGYGLNICGAGVRF